MICLRDSTSTDFCSDVEASWNITTMNATGQATWPNYTMVIYPDYDTGVPEQDVDGTYISPLDPFEPLDVSSLPTDLPLVGREYYYNTPIPIADDNFGTSLPLRMDQYPLQIQNKFVNSLTSTWGAMFDMVTEQVWSNVQLNCGLNYNITAANNVTGAISDLDPDYDDVTNYTATSCPRVIFPNTGQACQDFVIQNEVATAALSGLNGGFTCSALSASYCAPAPCPVTVVQALGDYKSFVAGYTNITLTQFKTWNPFVDVNMLQVGDVVCVGPMGGAYTPTLVAQATPLVYTTTAIPAEPTRPGTIPNCGLYYDAQPGDGCGAIALNFSITLNQFIAMNPSVDLQCDGFWADYDYCVAPVNGTMVSSASSTQSSVAASATGSSNTSATAAANATLFAPGTPVHVKRSFYRKK
ncbi:hypothetical protein MMC18_007722 [Xylographa bjoerkii]|nr:hypothetical protein [Xylographa bjoerkii]